MSIGYLYIPFQFGECVCWSLTLTGTGTSGCVHVHLVNSEIHIALHTKAHGRQGDVMVHSRHLVNPEIGTQMATRVVVFFFFFFPFISLEADFYKIL